MEYREVLLLREVEDLSYKLGGAQHGPGRYLDDLRSLIQTSTKRSIRIARLPSQSTLGINPPPDPVLGP